MKSWVKEPGHRKGDPKENTHIQTQNGRQASKNGRRIREIHNLPFRDNIGGVIFQSHEKVKGPRNKDGWGKAKNNQAGKMAIDSLGKGSV